MRRHKYIPDLYVERLTEIDIEYLKEKNIKGVILDLDNTIIDLDKIMVEGAIEWHDKIRESGIKSIIVSNSFFRKRVEKTANQMGINYIYRAAKPRRKNFRKALEILKLKSEQVAVIGDQVLTDVKGAKKMGMHSILVKPITTAKEYFFTKIKRPFEKIILKEYFREMQERDAEEKKKNENK